MSLTAKKEQKIKLEREKGSALAAPKRTTNEAGQLMISALFCSSGSSKSAAIARQLLRPNRARRRERPSLAEGNA